MTLRTMKNIRQWSLTANLRRTDCGIACIDDCLQYFGLGNFTVDQLVPETALILRDAGLTCGQVAELGISHGLNCKLNDHTTIDQITEQLNQGYPVIALIAYHYISNRLDIRDVAPNDGHFIVLLAIDGEHVVCNDPDWWSNDNRGEHILYKISEVVAAITNNDEGNGRCIFVQGKNILEPDHAAMITTKGNRGGVNLRVEAGIDKWAIAVMPDKSPIWILKAKPIIVGAYLWQQIQYDRWFGWCAVDFINDTSMPQPPLVITTPDLWADILSAAPTTKITFTVNGQDFTLTASALVRTVAVSSDSWLNVRALPTTSAKVVGRLQSGDRIVVSQPNTVTGGFVRSVAPTAGWIAAQWLK